MEQYGYLYNKFAKNVSEFATTPTLTNSKDSGTTAILVVSCILLFFVVYRYCL